MYVSGDDPVGRHDSIKPRQFRFVGMAVIAGVFEDRLDLSGSLYLGSDGRIPQFGSGEMQSCEQQEANSAESKQQTEVRGLWHGDFPIIDKLRCICITVTRL